MRIKIDHRMPLRILWPTKVTLPFSPDSAVGIDRDARHNPSAAKSMGLPRSRHRSAVLRGDVEPHSNDVRQRKMTLKLHSRTPSLLQDSTSLPAPLAEKYAKAKAAKPEDFADLT